MFPFDLVEPEGPRIGLIALQSDETIERDMRSLLPQEAEFMVTRVPAAEEVTRDTLAAMEGQLAAAASLFPSGVQFDVIGFGCTSGTAQIGATVVADRIGSAAVTSAVTQPLSSLVAACRRLGLKRLALLSPYVAQVSEHLREVLWSDGIETPAFGSFAAATEATVVRISGQSILDAAAALTQGADVDGVFLSCTNLAPWM
ncbi:MAG: Asp/Glu racemase [Pseudomonadota bacterium]